MSAGDVERGWHRALVVFSHATDLWWLRLLRPGFRHCFVALEMASGWVVVDPMSHYTFVVHFPHNKEFDLLSWYRQHEMKVVVVNKFSPERRVMPLRPYSCVESVKRILGIRAGFVLTPWQLYRHLNKRGTKMLTAVGLEV
ncbi:hypothetical protein [Magnetospirillum aberrantis]|uniref:Uncharacterized protein n=1 Tax=Magnetospirillum aberrantis SpK TaxID=908842 RepID=A0A7C9QUC9_9PROT|nr:hypothetical protein [Magnetospirillum aberrantis]NFV80804.1 hypothetical protein [Magnetospirillum aberrantis SpK]